MLLIAVTSFRTDPIMECQGPVTVWRNIAFELDRGFLAGGAWSMALLLAGNFSTSLGERRLLDDYSALE
jgi:hypothetical protein